MEEGQPAEAATPRKNAGGQATEAGMAFQADVGTCIAAHVLARLPVGGRFGINNAALPIAIRLETGEGLDDIEITQSDAGAIHIQCKTTATLGTGERAPLTKTVGQLARFVADAKAGAGLPLLTSNVASLAVREQAPASLNQLEAGLRAFDLGGPWLATLAQRSQVERGALTTFQTIATSAWSDHRGAPPSEADLVDMARIFRVTRFAMDEGAADWREASRILGRRVFGDEAAGDAPLRDLKTIVRSLIARGGAADRPGLLRALRLRGHVDVASPDFQADITKLISATERELVRLHPHGRLTIDGGLALARDSDGPMDAAIASGSLLVVGEPGAGKTGALVGAANRLKAAGDTMVFLSVDRFPGVAISADLQSELGLEHPLIDTLAAFPGPGRKVLIIDALDAARGGPAEAVFASLIEEARARLEDWTIVASIRTFDLRNGRRYRTAMAGSPPDGAYAEAGLANVRHFLVPRLTPADLTRLSSASTALAELFDVAPSAFTTLLQNIFNLSLAAQLLSDGATPASFAGIRSQSGLIDAYEDDRLATTPLQQAASATVGEMASRGRLAVRKVLVQNPALDDVIQSGVLVQADDLVSFAHHVLFDHIAGRFFLEWDDPDRLIAQIGGGSSKALMLAPALRFAIERVWRNDRPDRSATWDQVCSIFAAANVDPVVANVALRTAVENVQSVTDLGALIGQIAADPTRPGLATLLSRMARFVGLEIERSGGVTRDHAVAWASLAAAAIAPVDRALSDPARILLHHLFEKADLTEPVLLDVFGSAARALLEFAWAADPPMGATATNAIRFVGKSFASDPPAARDLLDRILREPRFSAHADKEATWLSDQIVPIARSDPEFAEEIYRVLFTQTISDDEKSWFGGAPSRIMPLSSNRRQDYAHCRWSLGCAMSEFLSISVPHATKALIDATLGKRISDGFGPGEMVSVDIPDGPSFNLAERDYGADAWDEPDEDRQVQPDDMFAQFVDFLRAASPEHFEQSLAASASGNSSGSVWSRLLGVGAERVADVGIQLWPYATHLEILRHANTMRDAVRLVVAAYPNIGLAKRESFETQALDFDRLDDDYDQKEWRRVLGRILKLLSPDDLATDAMRAFRAELEEADQFEENEPVDRMTVSWREHGGYYREMLEREGVDLDKGPEAIVLEASDRLHELVQQTPATSGATELATLWADAVSLLGRIDEPGVSLHERIAQPAWGHVANAVDRIVDSASYSPGNAGLPTLADMMAILDRLSASPYPKVKAAS